MIEKSSNCSHECIHFVNKKQTKKLLVKLGPEAKIYTHTPPWMSGPETPGWSTLGPRSATLRRPPGLNNNFGDASSSHRGSTSSFSRLSILRLSVHYYVHDFLGSQCITLCNCFFFSSIATNSLLIPWTRYRPVQD